MSNTRGKVILSIVAGLIVTVCVICAVLSISGTFQLEKEIRSGADVSTLLESHEYDVLHVAYSGEKNTELIGLIQNASPETLTQELFVEVSEAALESARKAIDLDPTEPAYHQSLANVYSTLGISGVDGAVENAAASLERALTYDPYNPKYHFGLAQVALITDDRETAIEAINAAIALKSNYLPAIQLQSEIAVAEDTVAELIDEVIAVVALQPTNAVRFFQLGFLQAADKNPADAAESFKRALRIDGQYADARYSLALQYLELDMVEEALVELRIVQATNPGNTQLEELITFVSSDSYTSDEPLPEVDIDTGTTDNVPSQTGSDTIVPVNTVPDSNP